MDNFEYPKLYSAENNCSIVINNNPFKVGRGLNCDYVIPNYAVSRLHCQFERNGNQWYVRDTSTNGTFVNGELIKSILSAPLKDSDTVQLSPDTCKYNFQSTFKDEISDEQLCVITDVLLENIVTSSVPTTSNEIIRISDVSPVKTESSISVINSLPKKRIKVSDTSTVCIDLTNNTLQDAVASTSSAAHSIPTIELDDSCKDSDLKMCIERGVADSSKIHTVKPSTSVTTDMGQTESRECEQKQENMNDSNEMDDDYMCAICSELFVKATTLNCSHTFCKYCVETWKKKQPHCPICRTKITSQVPTLVLDNVIDKIIQNSKKDVRDHRKELLEDRTELHKNVPVAAKRKNDLDTVELVEDTSSDTLDDSSSDTSSLPDTDVEGGWEAEYWNDDWYDRSGNTGYYGGYGRCFSCGRPGHWSTGCPYR